MTTATAVLILAVFVVLDLLKYWISEVSEPRERERERTLCLSFEELGTL